MKEMTFYLCRQFFFQRWHSTYCHVFNHSTNQFCLFLEIIYGDYIYRRCRRGSESQTLTGPPVQNNTEKNKKISKEYKLWTICTQNIYYRVNIAGEKYGNMLNLLITNAISLQKNKCCHKTFYRTSESSVCLLIDTFLMSVKPVCYL